MSLVSVLEACAIPLTILALLWLMNRSWRREQARKQRWEQLWLERQRERYWRYEFDVTPPVFDQESEAA